MKARAITGLKQLGKIRTQFFQLWSYSHLAKFPRVFEVYHIEYENIET